MEQDQTLESQELLRSPRASLSRERTQRFLIGFLFAMAFFLIEAGIAEILLARNEACLQTISDFRLSPDPSRVCMSEFEFFLARGLSRGAIGTLSPETSAFIVWPILAIFYGLVGGGLAQFPLRAAIGGFLLVHILLLMAFMAVDFMSQFIILDLPDPAPN